jgi:CHAD domain-containing protein
LPGIPPHRKPASRARRLLRKLRRAAGSVRDVDVQRDLIRQHSSPATEKDARELRKILKHLRSDTAASLLDRLQHHQAKLTLSLESLLKALEPAESLTLTSTQLITLIQNWFTRSTPEPAAEDHKALHTLRKNAKLARYIAETAGPGARAPRQLARHFESVQQMGGTWHDYHSLAEVASHHLGKSAPLTKDLHRQRETVLTSYRTSVRRLRSKKTSK